MTAIPFPQTGLGDVVDKVRQAAGDLLAGFPCPPDLTDHERGVRLAQLVDPLIRHVVDLGGALQAVAGVLTFDGAPPAPCDKCLTPATMADELPPGVPYTVAEDGRYHYAGCRCDCHTRRVAWYNEETERARAYVSRVLAGRPAGPNPAIVGYLTAFLHARAVREELDRGELEKIVEWLAVTNPHFRAMLTTLCEAALGLTKEHRTLAAAVDADKAQKARDFQEAARGATRILTDRGAAGAGGGAGCPDGGDLPLSG